MTNHKNTKSAIDMLLSTPLKTKTSKVKQNRSLSVLVPVDLFESMEKLILQKITETGDASYNKTTLVNEAINAYIEKYLK